MPRPKRPSAHAEAPTSATDDLFETPGAGRWVVVRGGTVLAMTGKPALPRHDVLIRDGVIEDVRPTGRSLPVEAVVVEAAARFVLPGLTDIHTHPFVQTWAQAFKGMVGPGADPDACVLPYDLLMFQYLAAGVTRIEVMAGCEETLAIRRRIDSGEMRGPTMRIGSPMIDGHPPMRAPFMSWVATDAGGGRTAAREIARRGFDFAKPYSNLSREAHGALVEECQALGIRLMGHVPEHVGVEDAIARGQQGIAHAMEFFQFLSASERDDRGRLEHLARVTAERGVWVQATLAVAKSVEMSVGDLPLSAPDLEMTNPLMTKYFTRRAERVAAVRKDPVMAARVNGVLETAALMTRMLHTTGAKVLTGTDVCNPYLADGFSLHEELQLLVENAGFSPIEAIEASTALTADYHGESSTAGRIAAGMRSDIIVLDRDPTVSIDRTRSIDTVVIGNAILRREAIAAGVARIKARFAAMPI